MKRRKANIFISIIMVVVMLASMLSILDHARAAEQIQEDSFESNQEEGLLDDLSSLNQKEDEALEIESYDTLDETEEIPEAPEWPDIAEAPELMEAPEMMSTSALNEVMPLNATIFTETTVVGLRSRITALNASEMPVVIIRIPNNLDWQSENHSGMIPVSHPNLTIEAAGSGHFTLTSSSNGAFQINAGANLTLRGGPGGGRLTLRGGLYSMGCLVRGTLNIENGITITNYPVSGVRVDSGGILNISGDARFHLNRNRQGPGGGVWVRGGGRFNMDGGSIEFNTGVQGGGVHVEQGGIFHMRRGQIRNNFSVNATDWQGNIVYGSGGGLYVPHSNLDNITIEPAAVFMNNVAETGIRINTELAMQYQDTIRPGRVSVSDTGLYLTEEGTFANITPHAFTNYDINTDLGIPQFWQVSYQVMSGNGTILAKLAATGIVIPNEAFVPEGTEVIFEPDPASLLNRWEIGTRLTIINEDGNIVPFRFVGGGSDTPLSHEILEHTHIRGYFSQGYSITKHPNGGEGEAIVRWVLPGQHQLMHTPTHANERLQFVGWNTIHDGSGIHYDGSGIVTITNSNITLYAQWGITTTTLTISKEVTGILGNKNMEFTFEVFFTTALGQLLTMKEPLKYTITDEHMAVVAEGIKGPDELGRISFKLSHGQTIRFEGVSLNCYIQIFEESVARYQTSFVDSAKPDVSVRENNTEILAMTADRSFHFTNGREYVPPTNVDMGNIKAMWLLAVVAVLLTLSGITFHVVYRCRSR